MTLIYRKEKLVPVREIDQKKTGASFAAERKNAGVSQRQLAYQLGVTPARICQLEKVSQKSRWTKEYAKRYEAALNQLSTE